MKEASQRGVLCVFQWQISRLMYTNSGTSILALASNAVHHLWRWLRTKQNLGAKVTSFHASLQVQIDQFYIGGFGPNIVISIVQNYGDKTSHGAGNNQDCSSLSATNIRHVNDQRFNQL